MSFLVSRIIKLEVGKPSASADNPYREQAEAYKLEEEYTVLVVLKYRCVPTFHVQESCFKVSCK